MSLKARNIVLKYIFIYILVSENMACITRTVFDYYYYIKRRLH